MATVRRIFDLAAAIVFEQYGGDTDFDKYSPLLLEQMMMEALPDYQCMWDGEIDATLSVYIGDGVLGTAVQILD